VDSRAARLTGGIAVERFRKKHVETSVQPSAAQPALAMLGVDEEAGYRTVSVLSIVSLILGLAAPLCLMAP
jgi:hypothetical protein